MKQPALDTLKWGTDYLLKTFEVDSDPEHKTPNRTQYNIIYQVRLCMHPHAHLCTQVSSTVSC